MNPRINFVLNTILRKEDFPDIDVLNISYHDDTVILRGAKEDEEEWSWEKETTIERIFPILTLFTKEVFHYRKQSKRTEIGNEEYYVGKLYNSSHKSQVVGLEIVIPECITLIVYDYGVEKIFHGDYLSDFMRESLCLN